MWRFFGRLLDVGRDLACHGETAGEDGCRRPDWDEVGTIGRGRKVRPYELLTCFRPSLAGMNRALPFTAELVAQGLSLRLRKGASHPEIAAWDAKLHVVLTPASVLTGCHSNVLAEHRIHPMRRPESRLTGDDGHGIVCVDEILHAPLQAHRLYFAVDGSSPTTLK